MIMMAFLLMEVVSALSVEQGNFTVQPHCYNGTSGAFFGTQANLTVKNESGTFFVIDDLVNTGPGSFSVNLTNLSAGHCYTLELGCKDEGALANEHSTVCVSWGDDGVLGTLIAIPLVFALVFVVGAFLLQDKVYRPVRTAAFALSFVAFTASMNLAVVFVQRKYGWSDVSSLLVKITTISWVVLGVVLLYLGYAEVRYLIEEKRKKNEEG